MKTAMVARAMGVVVVAVLLAVPMSACAQASSRHAFDVAKNLEVFNAIYEVLDMMYVDTLDADEVVGVAVGAMLRSLDPYTEYYPENRLEEYRQMLTGKYAGIGSIISYSFTRQRVVINEPYADMPAAEMGLRKGDVILSIDGEDMTDKDNAYVSEHLRGDAGTTFLLRIMRPTTGEEIEMRVQRRTIQTPMLPYYGVVDGDIGYICFDSFLEGSEKEFRRAFIELRRRGIAGLVVDLRENGGGSLQSAVDILNIFLPKGIDVVTMKGKMERSNQTFTTSAEPIDTLMPVVVLVGEMTASAAEIMCGTMQDLDRGVVLGTKTYGKGLVQVPNVPLPYNGNLKLTTAKYYIPSGRCIQAVNYRRSQSGGEETAEEEERREFRTSAGRTVRDGGGIMPDVVLEPDSLPNIVYYLDRGDTTDVLLNYEIDYIASHPQVASPAEFALTDADYAELCRRAVESGFAYDYLTERYLDDLERLARFEGYYDDAADLFAALREKLRHDIARDMAYPYNRAKIVEMVEADLMAAYYYQAGMVEHSLLTDKQMAEAVRLLHSPEEYAKLLAP